jgi:hypothetical protein
MSSVWLVRLGFVGVITAILGVASGGLMLAWPPQVPEEMLSYPFTPDGFRTIQLWFAVHHLGLIAVLVGFAGAAGLGRSRLARAGAILAVIGMVGLTGMEVYARGFAEWQTKAANEGTMGAGYGITTSLVGLGMVVAGIAVLRTRQWTGPWRQVPLAIGVMHFVVVTPAIFSNIYVLARIAIVTWIALFGALGWALVREARARASDPG